MPPPLQGRGGVIQAYMKIKKQTEMKKRYCNPAAEAVEIKIENVMQIVTGSTAEVGSSNEKVDNNTPDLAGRQKDNWGSLWNK